MMMSVDAPAGAPGREPPDGTAVARRQLALVGRGRRRELLLLLIVAAALIPGQRFSGVSAPEVTSTAAQILLSSSHFLLLLVALFWSASVWRNEGPGRRTYHWTLPIDRRVHDLLRVGAGAAWLLGTIAFGAVLGLGIGLASGAPISVGDWRVYPALALGLLVVYGLGSVAALLSDHPYRWIIGVPILYVAVRSLSELVGAEPISTVMASVETGRLGLFTAVIGPRAYASEFWSEQLGAGAPLLAILVWLGIACVAVLAAASVHPERTAGGG